MTLKECYAALEGDYDSVVGRLQGERLVQKFILRFPDDPSYDLLCRSMDSKDYAEAFRAAHTIKGVCQNLDLTKLYHSSAALCESLRDGFHPEALDLLAPVKADYEQTVAAIRTFQATLAG